MSTVDVEVKMHGANRSTGMLYLYDWNIGDYVWVKSFPMKGSPSASVTVPVAGPWDQYIGPGNQVKAIVRSVLPTRLGGPFVLKIDLIRLLYRT